MLNPVIFNYVLALISGVLLVLVHPRANLTFCAPLAIAPLVYALAREWRPRHRFLLGYLTGVSFWAGINYWIQFVMDVHGGLGPAGGAAVFILFCLIKGLHLGVFGLLAGILVQTRYALPSIALLWVAIERIPTPFGYTWLTLGNAGIDMGLPMRLAPYTGVYGLSLVFALFGVAVALLALRRPRTQLVWALAPLLLVVLPELPPAANGDESAVVLQPNIEEERVWTESSVEAMQQRLQYLSLQSALAPGLRKPAIILWPEVPAPLYYYDDLSLRTGLETMTRLAGAPVLMGTVAHTKSGSPLNSALMVTTDGAAAGRYDKMFLVPFGEYIPFPFDGLARKISGEIGDFVPGERIVAFPLENAKIAAFICYESAFPHLVRQFVKEGAVVLANLSNDGYFGTSAARQQHLSLVRMRAAENRRWIIRATNNGITASIDPAGRVIGAFQPFEEQAGRLPYSAISDVTFYSRHGDWFAWSCVAFSLVALAASQIPGRG